VKKLFLSLSLSALLISPAQASTLKDVRDDLDMLSAQMRVTVVQLLQDLEQLDKEGQEKVVNSTLDDTDIPAQDALLVEIDTASTMIQLADVLSQTLGKK
jgi:hypothetical protein